MNNPTTNLKYFSNKTCEIHSKSKKLLSLASPLQRCPFVTNDCSFPTKSVYSPVVDKKKHKNHNFKNIMSISLISTNIYDNVCNHANSSHFLKNIF